MIQNQAAFLTIFESSVIASCNFQQFDCFIIITVIAIDMSNLQIFAHELKIYVFLSFFLSFNRR